MEGCDATIEGDTEDEVLDRAAAHAAEAHPDLELDDETVGAIRDAIQDV